MYNVMIVDDEAPARALLQMKVDWASMDCQITAMAKNGKEAFELYEKEPPDLVITDIQMPVMNGLDLIQNIKEKNPEQPIVILSCHESFSFARKAIQLGVDDYLIKDSFEAEELYGIVGDLFKNRKSSAAEQSTDAAADTQKEKSVITRELIMGELTKEVKQTYITNNQLNLHGNRFVLLYVDIEIVGQDVTNPDSQFLKEAQTDTVESLSVAALKEHVLGEVCHISPNTLLVLYAPSSGHSQTECRREALTIANHIRHNINDRFDVQTTIGVSEMIEGLDHLHQGYLAAKETTNRKIIGGYDKTYISNVSSSMGDDQYIKILNVKLNRIGDYLNSNKFEPIIKEINDIFLQNLKGFMQYNYLKHTNWTLLSMLIEFCSKNSLSFIEISGSRSPWEAIMDIKTVDGMCKWFEANIHKIESQLSTPADDSHSYHVSKCIKYIHQNYSENISLRDLSDMYDINNAYLSRIFKKETGKSLTDFINDVRIEEAKKLIQNTSLKMYEIAEQCGFSSTQRFFMVFKKVVGTSPGDFRKA